MSALPYVLLAAGLLLAIAVRLRLLDVPLERDEGEYAYAGQLILEGSVPYGEAHNMKLPGTYYAYALIMMLFGQTSRGIHLGLTLWTACSALLLFALGRRLFDPLAGAVAAASFALLSASPTFLGLAGHATHFVVLPALAGCFGILWPGRRERLGLAGAGLAFGIAFLMKQQAAALMMFGLLFVLWRSRAKGWRTAAGRGAVFSLGAAIPYALLCLYLAATGVFDNFWFWTVTYARAYVSVVPLSAAVPILLEYGAEAVGWNAPIWVAAFAGGVVFFLRGRDDDSKAFLAGLTVFSFVAVCPGFFFREHYFIVMLPAVGLLAGAGVAAFPAGGPTGRKLSRARAAWALAAVAAMAIAVAAQRAPLFSWDVTRVSRENYGANPFPESVEIARYIAANSSPEDRIAILGSEPQIYFYAHRRSATRYVYAYAMMEPNPYAGWLQDQVMREIEAARPLFVVLVRVQTSWLTRPSSDMRIFEWINSYFFSQYDVAGWVAMRPAGPSRYVWGAEAARQASPGSNDVIVLRRRN